MLNKLWIGAWMVSFCLSIYYSGEVPPWISAIWSLGSLYLMFLGSMEPLLRRFDK